MSNRAWLVVSAVLLPVVWIPAVISVVERDPPAAPSAGPTPVEVVADAAGEADPAPPPTSIEPFARARGVRLVLPAVRARVVAFHESSMPGAVRMRPFGSCRRCQHYRFEAPPRDGSSLRYVVMAPRGRGTAPTSAVDVVVDEEELVLSPVDGTVRSTRRYPLYGRYRDVRIAIVPEDAPGLRVVLLHLRGVRLEPGDGVVAGATALGRARRLPFPSQVDRYVGDDHPHVHLEVVDAEARNQAKNRRRSGR